MILLKEISTHGVSGQAEMNFRVTLQQWEDSIVSLEPKLFQFGRPLNNLHKKEIETMKALL